MEAEDRMRALSATDVRRKDISPGIVRMKLAPARRRDASRADQLSISHEIVRVNHSSYNVEKRGNDRDREYNKDRDRDTKCYGCNGYGHMARNCPEKRNTKETCHICSEPGHFARECPKKGEDRRNNDGCFKCHEKGHIARDCTKKE